MDEDIQKEMRARRMNLGDPAGTGSSASNIRNSADSNAAMGRINPSADLASESVVRQAPPINNYRQAAQIADMNISLGS